MMIFSIDQHRQDSNTTLTHLNEKSHNNNNNKINPNSITKKFNNNNNLNYNNNESNLNRIRVDKTSNLLVSTTNNNFLKRISSKCLVLFGLFAISLVLVCSVLIAFLTTRYFITSQSIQPNEWSNSQSHNKANNNDPFNNKTERNSFTNWIKNGLTGTFFGSGSDDLNKINNQQVCGKPSVQPHLVNTRIMNGKEALPYSWPWAVSIALEGPRDYVPHACGGTLINSRYVVTAAHCVQKNSIFGLVGSPQSDTDKYNSVEKMMKIYVGIHDRMADIRADKIFGVEKVIVHYNFDPNTFKNDIALIKLDRDVEVSNQVNFICLTKSSQVAPGDIIYAVGWGYTEETRNQASRYLMQVDLIVQRRDTCLIQYDDQDQFCAGNVYQKKDTCNGDSGGPLLKLVDNRWTLMGVVSNGDVSCGGTGIYINAPFYYDWIIVNSQD